MDRLAALSVRDFAAEQMPWLLLVHAALLLGLGLWSARRAPRGAGRAWRLAVTLALAVGLVVRVVVLPVARHVYDGHEADYFDAWRQVGVPSSMGYRFYPALATLYRIVGAWLGGSGEALLCLSLAVGLLTLALAALWVRRLTGDGALALVVTVALVLDPAHAFWSSSAYNVTLPLAAALLSSISLETALRRTSAPALALAALWGVLAVATRIESILMVLPLAAQALSMPGALRRLGLRRLALALAPAALLGLWHAAALGLHVPRPEGADSPLDYAGAMFGLQYAYLGPLKPWGGVVPLGLAAAGLAVALVWGPMSWRRAGVVCLAGVLPVHLVYAIFDDYGARHTLFMRVCLALCCAMALLRLFEGRGRAATRGPGGWAFQALAVALAALWAQPLIEGLADANRRYYATAELFVAEEPGFRTLDYVRPELYAARCVFVSESWFYRDFKRASHFEIFDPEQFKALREQHDDCVIFVYDLENYQLSSRAIDERADKLTAFFTLVPMGKRMRPHLEDFSLLYRIEPSGSAPASLPDSN